MATSELILCCVFPSAVWIVTEKQSWKFKRQAVKNILLKCSCHVRCERINFCLNNETGKPVKQQSIHNGILRIMPWYTVSSGMWNSPTSASVIYTPFRDKMRGNISPVWQREQQIMTSAVVCLSLHPAGLGCFANQCQSGNGTHREWWKAGGGRNAALPQCVMLHSAGHSLGQLWR